MWTVLSFVLFILFAFAFGVYLEAYHHLTGRILTYQDKAIIPNILLFGATSSLIAFLVTLSLKLIQLGANT